MAISDRTFFRTDQRRDQTEYLFPYSHRKLYNTLVGFGLELSLQFVVDGTTHVKSEPEFGSDGKPISGTAR